MWAQRCLADADALKQDGNAAFRAGQVADALAAYRSALGRLPKRALPAAPRSAPDKPRSTRAQGEESDEDEFFDAAEEPDAKDGEEVEGGRPVPYAEECAKARAVLNGNVAACYAKLVRAIALPVEVSADGSAVGRAQGGGHGVWGGCVLCSFTSHE